MEPIAAKRITVTVNGDSHEREVEARRLLVHFLRDDLDLTGTHIGCDTGNCGACTVIYDGMAIKSCMGLAADGELHPLQKAFRATHALQCGYCTPGMLMSAKHLLEHNAEPTDEEIRRALQGNICRCTGYVNIVEAVQAAAKGEVDT